MIAPGDASQEAALNRETGNLPTNATIEYRHELVRKSIHLCSLSIPTIYFFISRELALTILVPMMLAFLATDLARYYLRPVSEWFYRCFGWLLRQHEQDSGRMRLTGATNVLIAAVLTVTIFPKVIAVTAFAILIISDSTSALIGRRFGRHRFLGKSLEGSAAFFLSAVLVVLASPKLQGSPLEYGIGFLGGAVGAVVEALPVKIDDNLSIPLCVGAAMWILYAMFAPHLDLLSLQ